MSLNWVRRLTCARIKPICHPSFRARHRWFFQRLWLETLESRLAPAVHTWTGLGMTNSWGEAANWSGGTPAGDMTPTLVFPPSSPRMTSLNDVSGRVVHEIIIQANGYTIAGSSFTLDGSLTLDAGVTSTAGVMPQNSPTDTIGLRLHSTPTITVVNHSAALFLGGPGGPGSAPISGDSGFIQNGDGSVIFSGPDTFTGTTTLVSGTLQLLSGASLGSGTVNLDGGTLLLSAGINLANAITVGDSNHAYASGTLTGSGTLSGNLTISPLATLVESYDTGTISGSLNGTGSLFVDHGTVTLLGNNGSYSGTVTLSGQATVGNNNALGTGPIIFSGSNGTITPEVNNLTISNPLSVGGFGNVQTSVPNFTLTGPCQILNGLLVFGTGTVTFAGSIVGTGGLSVQTGITAVLSAANSYTGVTSISGTLRLGVENGLSSLAGFALGTAGVLDLQTFDATVAYLTGMGKIITATSGGRTLTVSGPQITAWGGVMSGSGGLTRMGSGSLTLFGANTYTGATTVTAGTLQLQAANTLSSASPVTVTGGTLQLGVSNPLSSAAAVTLGAAGTLNLNNYSLTIGSLTGSGNVALGTGTLTTGSNTDTTFSGIISGAGGLMKAGMGTFTLGGSNTFTGPTTINAGTLLLNSNNALQNTSSTVVNAAGTLNIANGTDTFTGGITGAGAVTLSGALAIAVIQGTYSMTGMTTVNNGILIAATTGTLQSLTIGGGSFQVQATRTLTVTNATLSAGEVAGAGTFAVATSGQLTWSSGTIDGTGMLMISHGATLMMTGFGAKREHGEQDCVYGTQVWASPGGVWSVESGSSVTVESGATFRVNAPTAGNFTFDGDGTGSFTNLGTVQCVTNATITFTANVAFHNSGQVNVLGGQLTLANGTSNGAFTVAAGGTLVFAGSTFSLMAGASFSGAGNVTFAGGTTAVNVPYAITSTSVTGGTVTFTSASGVTFTTLAVMGGTLMLAFTSMVNLTTLSVTSGALTSMAAMTVSGVFNWSGGTLLGPGTMTIANPAQLNLSGPNGVTLDGCPLSIAGTANWSASGPLNLRNGATLTVQSTGLLNAQADADINPIGGTGVSSFTNNGTFRKSAGLGGTSATAVNITFTNNGILDVRTGTLQIAGLFTNFSGGTLTGGTYLVAGTLQFNQATSLSNNAAQVTLNAPGAHITDLSGVDALANLSSIAVGGSFIVQGNASYTITGANSLYNYGTVTLGLGSALGISNGLANFGTVTLAAESTLSTASNGFYNDATVALATSSTLNLDSSGFYNDVGGTVTPLAGDGFSSAIISSGVTNYGTLMLGAGLAMGINNGLANFGTVILAAGAFLSTASNGFYNNGTVTLAGGSALSLDSSGFYIDTAGTVTTLGPGSSRISSGVYNAGIVTLGASATAGSTLSIGGDLTEDPAGTLSLQFGGSPSTGVYGQLHITGNANLTGTLTASLVNPPFMPNLGDSYTVMTFGNRNGDFATENLNLGGGRQLVPMYSSSSLTLVTAAGGPGSHRGHIRGIETAESKNRGDRDFSSSSEDPDGEGHERGYDAGTAGVSVPSAVEDLDALFASLRRHSPADEVGSDLGLLPSWSDIPLS